jgi:hypothetical protein
MYFFGAFEQMIRLDSTYYKLGGYGVVQLIARRNAVGQSQVLFPPPDTNHCLGKLFAGSPAHEEQPQRRKFNEDESCKILCRYCKRQKLKK